MGQAGWCWGCITKGALPLFLSPSFMFQTDALKRQLHAFKKLLHGYPSSRPVINIKRGGIYPRIPHSEAAYHGEVRQGSRFETRNNWSLMFIVESTKYHVAANILWLNMPSHTILTGYTALQVVSPLYTRNSLHHSFLPFNFKLPLILEWCTRHLTLLPVFIIISLFQWGMGYTHL